MVRNRAETVTVVPVYRPDATPDELRRVAISRKFFPGPTVLIGPRGLNFDAYRELVPDAEVLALDAKWFSSKEAYSNLMLQPWLYDYFRRFRFMLVYQLDAILVKQVPLECFLKLDYVGAPWAGGFRLGWNPFTGTLGTASGPRFRRRVDVGNGGLSLRRVSAFRLVSRLVPPVSSQINEDLIYAFFGPLLGLRIASLALARSSLMETEALQWNSGDAIPEVWGFHAIGKFNPHLEKTLIQKGGES